MSKIGIFYGSASGVTQSVAMKIRKRLGQDICDLYNMEEDFDDVDDMLKYDFLLFGCSTWGAGEVQSDWRDPLFEMSVDKPDFSGKTIALFGAGDCVDHGEHFVSALGTLYDDFTKYGATLVGAIPTDGYTYKNSFAERDGTLVGLAFDEVNESGKTQGRLDTWIEVIRAHFPSAEGESQTEAA